MKKALITGSSSGIGQAIAIEFAKSGILVAINYHKNKKGAEETKKFCDLANNFSNIIIKADLTDKKQTVKMFSDLTKQNFMPSILVNNAAGFYGGNIFDNKAWEHQFKNILMTYVYTTQSFLSQKNSSRKKLINISSIYGDLATSNPESYAYSAMKAAINNMTKNIAKEFGGKVLVNAIAPGYTWTPPWYGISPQEKKRYSEKTKIKRFVLPEEIAHCARMLIENDAITGQIITVDGGTSLLDMNKHR